VKGELDIEWDEIIVLYVKHLERLPAEKDVDWSCSRIGS
jgi:hypothetical protein